MLSLRRLFPAISASLALTAAACGGGAPPPPVSTTTTSSGVAALSREGLTLHVESDGATLVRDREGRTQASILLFETAFASEARVEFPLVDRRYTVRLPPGTSPAQLVDQWIAHHVVSNGNVDATSLERFAAARQITLRSSPEGASDADQRLNARACDRCQEEYRACDTHRSTERQYARAGHEERACERELRACGNRANVGAARRNEEWPCGHPKP